MKTFLLYLITVIAEIVGCYLPWLWLRQGGSAWLLLPAAASLAAFAWLLTLHDAASGRVYAADGGVYIGAALVWLWAVDGIRPSTWDIAGAAVALAGMSIIAFQPRLRVDRTKTRQLTQDRHDKNFKRNPNNSRGNLDSRLCQHAYGYLIGNDP